ncbi:hypothetical protein LOZ65_005581 [Ophidiomyces ophidiicola]|nr:hypothetical protein LOZ65_005581 [Ophidiomyces ophidiicola]
MAPLALASLLLLLPLALAQPRPPPQQQLSFAVQQTAPASSDATLIPLSPGQSALDAIIASSPLLSLHRSLCEIESISNHEENAGDFLVDYLQRLGFTVTKQPVPLDSESTSSKRFNIYAYSPASPAPKILLTSHIDTVPPYIPYSVSLPPNSTSAAASSFNRRDIRIAGRGTVDAKGAVASQVIAMLSYLADDPTAPLGLLFVVSEETGGLGMRHFSDSPLNTSPPTFHTIIFGEPTEKKLVAGHKGMLHFTVNARGKAAHSGYPWLGHSAISEILPVLSKLDKLGDIPVSEGGLPSSDKYGKTTVNIGAMHGGIAANVVPANASASITVRLAGGTLSEAKGIVSAAVRAASNNSANVRLDFVGGGYPPVDLDADVVGFDVITVNYGTDVPNLKIHDEGLPEKKKVKRYLYGPGTIFVAHGENEGLTVGDLEDATEGYRKLIKAAMERKKE